MHGLIVLDKAAGATSHRALGPLKRALGGRTRVGHAGTLDPFATGALLALLGDATRLAGIATALRKSYVATVRFGRGTDTLDPDGETVSTADPGARPPEGLEAALAPLRGEVEQTPPAYSALRVGGRRAHRLARRGEPARLAPRPVTIHRLELAGIDWPSVRLDVECGAGTYVRAIARDLGAALGLPAHLAALRRTAVGPFLAADGLEVAEETQLRRDVLASRLLPPVHIARAAGLPEARLDEEAAGAFAQGRTVAAPGGLGVGAGARVAAIRPDGETLLGLAELCAGGGLRPVRVLASAVG